MAALLAAVALAGCPASTVHYGATPVGTPWVRSGAITGNLFAYSGAMLMDERVNGSDGLVLYTRGGTGSPAMKVLWTMRRASASLTLRGIRLDAPGAFTQRFAGGREVPSILKIPAAGCWRLALSAGKAHASFVVSAVDPPSESVCEPTRVHRDDIAWMPTTPSSNGIVAKLFVSTVEGADRALVYAGGAKFLWTTPHPGPQVTLSGVRLDRAGSFRQSFPSAASDSPPVTGIVFPSNLVIPASGCWAVRVSIGGRTGLAVFEAVVT
jgi:hypothetical protein